MKPRLLDHLVCPLDRTPLELVAWEHDGDEIRTGVLVNRARRLAYPIHGGVPRMLIFRTGLHDEFIARHGSRLSREEPGLSLPDEPGAPGERDVLRSFSTEWTEYDWDGQAYWNLTPDAWYRCMRYMLDIDERPVQGKLVLEVGIGIGAFADHLAGDGGAEVVGMDLGYAVDAAHRNFGRNPRLHVVQGSAFAPPLRGSHFDLVYSFGVIHHTYSTRDAFARLQDLPKPGGRLFIWVYSPEHERRTMERRILMAMERVIRPALWRLPTPVQTAALLPLVPLYMGSQVRRRLAGGGGAQVLYGVREALHAARDRFTPRYIHRHTDAEVEGWFRAAGYQDLVRASARPRPEWLPIAFTVCTGIDGVRG